MLPPQRSLKANRDFDKIKKEGKAYHTTNFTLLVYDRGDSNPTRFGFIVSNKIDKFAVHRNRIRRAIREAVRRMMFETPVGIDMLFIAKEPIVKLTTEEIMRDVRGYLKDNFLISK